MARTKYFQYLCKNAHCKGYHTTVSHKLVGSDGNFWHGLCEECGKINLKEAPEVIHGKQRYPYVNGSTGQYFESKEQEKKFVKENKLEGLGAKERINS